MMPAHGASDGQGSDEKLSLIDIYKVDRTRIDGKKDPAILKAFGSLSFFSFPLL